jgi:hypothetical protein
LVSGNVFGMVPFCFDLVILLANFLQLYMSSFSLNLFSLVDVPASLQILIMIVLAVLTSKMKSPWMRCIFNLLCMVSHAIAWALSTCLAGAAAKKQDRLKYGGLPHGQYNKASFQLVSFWTDHCACLCLSSW